MLRRRGVLAGALGLAALTACDVDDLRPPEEETPTALPTQSGSATPEPDADARLADEVGRQIAVTLALLDDARQTWPRLRKRLQPLARMHAAHAELLPAKGGEPSPAPTVTSTPGEAMAAVRDAEAVLHDTLVASAASARSGALARVLASMSASVSQHLAVLP